MICLIEGQILSVPTNLKKIHSKSEREDAFFKNTFPHWQDNTTKDQNVP